MTDSDNNDKSENNDPQDEVYDAEIVDDGGNETAPGNDDHRPVPLAPPDTILTPCHHGCGCGLHQQVVYGERVPEHDADLLDHGEMGLLTEAVGEATRILHDYHDRLQQFRQVAAATYGEASRALRDLAVLLNSDAVRRARAERDRVEDAYADLTEGERQPPARWLKYLAYFAIGGVGVFDAVFFQQAFLDIMQVSRNDPWWKQYVGLLAAIVLAVGLVTAGRAMTGPIWRLRRRWRRHATPDDPPLRWWETGIRVAAICAAPGLIFYVLGWWASFRGESALLTRLYPQSLPPVPPAIGVTLLLLSMSLTVVVLEFLIYNPYQDDLKRAEEALAKVRTEIRAGCDAASKAVISHQAAWGNLRSARDEVISFVLATLARPWETTILPARLRHGKAGPTAADAKHDVAIEFVPDTDQVRITYQIFEGIRQPQPGAGPLAEVVRAVLDYDPQTLKNEQKRLESELLMHLGDPAATGAEQLAEEVS